VVGGLVKPAGAAVVESLHFRARRLGKLSDGGSHGKSQEENCKEESQESRQEKEAGRKKSGGAQSRRAQESGKKKAD